MNKSIVLCGLLAACGRAAFVAEGVAQSPYVNLLKPGEVFAAAEENAGAGLVSVVDTDFVFDATPVEDFAVDGDVGKAVWKGVKPIPGDFVPCRKQEPIPYRSEIRLAYSKTALYVAATLWQDMKVMTAKWDQRDQATWDDDNLETFLYIPSDKGNRFYQYVINPLGTIADLCDENRAYWTKGMKLEVRRFDDRWTLEWKIPFKGIPTDRPIAGDFLGIRFCRTVHQPKKAVGTNPVLLEPGHCQRGRFAKLLFAEPSGPNAAKLVEEGRAYRTDMSRRRFYKRYRAFKARFKEVAGGTMAFADSTNALEKTALAGVAQMRKALKAFETRNAAALEREQPVPEAEAKALFRLAAGFERFASRHAYAVWTGDLWAVGSPKDLPPDGAAVMPQPLTLEQAGNEREAVCLNLRGLLCGSRVDVRLWPNGIDRKGQFLSTDSFEVYQEPFVRVENELVTAPLVKAAGNLVTLTPGRTVRVWLVFNSRGVPAGTYDTSVAFKSAADIAIADRALPVSVKVWGFTLPETREWPLKSFFWGAFQFNHDEVALLELMHDHHITHGWTQHHRYQYGMYNEKSYHNRWEAAKVARERGFDLKTHDFYDEVAEYGNEAFLKRAKELGMRFVIGWGTPGSLAWFKKMTARFRRMGFEYEDFVYKGLIADEFVKKQIPDGAAERAAVTAEFGTNLWFQAVYLSTPPPVGATMDDIEAGRLPEFYKMWTVIRGRCKNPKEGPDTIGRLRKKGCKVWSYECNRYMHVQNILSYYRLYAWECRMMGLDGMAIWTIYSPQGDGWDSRDGFDDGVAWRGLDRKPIPTKRLEAVREGLEDVAYMDLLEKALRAEKAKGRDHPEYGKLLADRDAIVKANDQEKVDAWRLAVGRAIDALTRR